MLEGNDFKVGAWICQAFHLWYIKVLSFNFWKIEHYNTTTKIIWMDQYRGIKINIMYINLLQ